MQPTTVNFRQSTLKDLMMCPLRWHYAAEGHERIQTSALLTGTAVHEAIRFTFDDQGAGTINPDPAHYFKLGWAAAEERAEEEGGVRWDDPKERLAVQAFVAYEYWYENLFPDLEPDFYEMQFVGLEVAPGLTIEGTIDYAEDGHIKDWKTAKRAYNQAEVEKDLQVSMYSLAYLLLYGELPKDFTFEVFIKGNTPRYESYVTSRSEEDIERFIFLLQRHANLVRSGAFTPNTQGWWCSARWCSYHEICPAGTGPVPVDGLTGPEGIGSPSPLKGKTGGEPEPNASLTSGGRSSEAASGSPAASHTTSPGVEASPPSTTPPSPRLRPRRPLSVSVSE